jgi:tagaturonate reductase
MKLSRYTLKNISPENVIVPDEEIFELPEKVLQFGTGMLLRGLPDYFIDKANRKGVFNGRIIMVKSTSRGDATAFDRQDGLYTLCERGIIDGKRMETNIISSSVSRVFVAQNDWKEILECAHNPNLKIIISNTTEVGIQFTNDDIRHHPPISYPGKLLAFLYERFLAFNGSENSGFVIVPTELILDNARKLESIVFELAHLNGLNDDFIEWLERDNYFCNSLVDRIVTGMPDGTIRNEMEEELGYKDDLLTVSEVYKLWAIEGDEKIKNILSFAEADSNVFIAPDIELYHELKLRLLNGTHTLTCGVALACNYETVQQLMEDPFTASFVEDMMRSEIAPSIPFEIDKAVKENFILKVLERFHNPHIHHYWRNISLNYSAKMQVRCIPLLINFYKNNDSIPSFFTLGFAAYLYFMKNQRRDGSVFYIELDHQTYLMEDEMSEKFYNLWNNEPVQELVKSVLVNENFWGYDLTQLEGFQQKVTEYLHSIINNGMKATLQSIHSQKLFAGNES